ncbi:DUF4350 domain-containing protein [Sphingorhabdus pulchriflava]|uniref:DUF4350 domain-containing protein n=1 Tax=Sphingorhabdus pulchriflava TaxID=2292257 RepID=UPI0015F1A239|nr:DUF4350 domain-containing protein [Sphingorhabdus pulchriflava]
MKSVVEGEGHPDPLFERLFEKRDVVAVDNFEQVQASSVKVAVLIQPKAFSPEDLVRLDNWVRAGGRLVFFADPALDWPTSLSLGDAQRPLFTSLHSPLFAHWGLELVLPVDAEHAHSQIDAKLGKFNLALKSPGSWIPTATGKTDSQPCRIERSALIAECRLGKGQAILVADVDMLNSDFWESAVPGVTKSSNIELAEYLIASAEDGQRVVGSAWDFLGN